MEEFNFKHGDSVTCTIKNKDIDDAKISIDKYKRVYICQNCLNGSATDDKLGYKYSWNIEYYHLIYLDILF